MTRLYLCALLLATLPACGSGGSLPPQIDTLLADMQGCARLRTIDLASMSATVRDQLQNPSFPVQLDTDGDGTNDTTLEGTISGDQLEWTLSGALSGSGTFTFQVGAGKVTLEGGGEISDGDCSMEFTLTAPFCVVLDSAQPLAGEIGFQIEISEARLEGVLILTEGSLTVQVQQVVMDDVEQSNFSFDLPAGDDPPNDPPNDPPGNSPVGDLLFSGNHLSRSGLFSFDGIDGGRVRPAVGFSTSGEQVWPTVSPLERNMAYASRDETDIEPRAIYVVPIDGSQNADLVQDTDNILIRGDFRHLAWSPDGKWIAATEGSPLDQIDMSHLVVIRVSDGVRFAVPMLSATSHDWHPTWSRDLDGTTPGYQGVLYYTNGALDREIANLAMVDAEDNAAGTLDFGDPVVVARHDDADVTAAGVVGFYQPSCSPDGSKIAFRNDSPFTAAAARIFIYHTVDGSITPNVSSTGEEPDQGDSDPTWWDDGTIVFSRLVGAAGGPSQGLLFRVDATGANQSELKDERGNRLDARDNATQPAAVPEALR